MVYEGYVRPAPIVLTPGERGILSTPENPIGRQVQAAQIELLSGRTSWRRAELLAARLRQLANPFERRD